MPESVPAAYWRIFERAPIGIVIGDRSGRVLSANERYCTIVGRAPAEVIGRHFSELLPPEDREAARRRYETFVASQAPGYRDARRYVRPDGSIARCNATFSLVQEEDEIDAVIMLLEDVTERELAEEELLANQEQLAVAQKLAKVGSWRYDFASNTRSWSDELCRMFGVPHGTSLSHEEFLAHIHPEDRERMSDEEAMSYITLEPFETCFRILPENGPMRIVDARGRFVLDEKGKLLRLIGMVQDVTDHIDRAEELRRVATQQSAVANLSQLALSGASLDAVFQQAVSIVASILDVELVELLERAADVFRVAAAHGFDAGTIGEEKIGSTTQARLTLESGHPIVVTNLAEETRFTPPELLVRHGVVSGVTVAVASSDGEPWGVLGAHSKTGVSFRTNDVDFLRSVAGVIAQAIGRHRSDAESQLRAERQGAIAELGRLAVTSLDDETLATTCSLVMRGLGVEYSSFQEISGDGRMLEHHAGLRSCEDLPAEMPVAKDTAAGLAVLTGTPVVIDDYALDRRFVTSPISASERVVSSLTVPVATGTRTFGVLSAETRTRRQFTAGDIEYMQSLANMVADALGRESARQALAESEERYRTVVEGASEIIFTLDKWGNILSLNHAFETITGCAREEWLGRSVADLFDACDDGEYALRFAAIVNSRSPTRFEANICGKDRTLLLDTFISPRLRDGNLAGVHGFARDVTAEREAELERQQLIRSLHLLLDSTVEGIYTMDVEGRCTMVNAAAGRMLGRTPQDMVGENAHQLVHGRHADHSLFPEADCPTHRVMSDLAPQIIINDVFWRSDGTALPVDYSAAPILDGDVAVGAVVAFTDTTERRKLELKLQQANRLASVGRLAATVAHEFNNVLMGISPFLEVMRRAPAKTSAAIEQIGRAVARGKRITEEILRFSRPEPVVHSVLDVEPLLQGVANEARSIFGSEYTIDVSVEGDNLRIDGDGNQLHQMMMNLLMNGRDAMAGGGHLAIAAKREEAGARFPFGLVDWPASFVHFTVTDTGGGVAEEALPHVFEPLFTTKKRGTGLGLVVAHQVVQRHGGDIFVESVLGEGSTFHVFIPITEDAVAAAPPRATISAKPSAARHVLLVDDDEIVSAGLMALLEMDGVRVETAATGAEALSKLRTSRPDAVVLDVGLPDIDGTQLYEQIVALWPSIPVVFSTGHAIAPRVDDLAAENHVRLLIKPYEFETLLNALQDVMTGD